MEEFQKKKLIEEEQEIVDSLMAKIEMDIEDADDRLSNILNNYRKAKEQGPEAYGIIVESQTAKKDILSGIQRAKQAKDELYTCRIKVNFEDEDGIIEEEEIKIGLSTYLDRNGKMLVCDWRRDVCRGFLLDNYAEETDGIVTDKFGEKHKTHYTLKLKRNVEARFGLVRDVLHLFPLSSEEAQKIIFDAFLSELANRRKNSEFSNIIFSIQKKQGEIIKLPYNENIIVQGCAGSGKSMIMLHRLPILLYDNPEILNNNNVYVISPSETYIQMVENMREELEITALKMGTLNQYFDHVLSKYGINLESYGRVSYATQVTKEQEDYVYGKTLSITIQNLARQFIDEKKHNFSEELIIFGIAEKSNTSFLPETEITNYILTGQSVIDKNNAVLKDYFTVCKSCVAILKDITDKIKNRRSNILRNIDREISSQEQIIEEKQKSLDTDELGDIAIKNRENAIKHAKLKIIRCRGIRKQVEEDDIYFQQVEDCCFILERIVEIFDRLKLQFEDCQRSDIYIMIENRKIFNTGYQNFLNKFTRIEMKYWEFGDDIVTYVKNCEQRLLEVEEKTDRYLELKYFEEVLESTEYFTKLRENIVQKIYLSVMEQLGQIPNAKGELKGLIFSPYLYLKIMYFIKGAPNAAKEKLICIDEAQGLAPEELKLIKDINGDKVIFNLFGDVKQHIEGTKGIDTWNEFCESIEAEEKLLMENYRNASQITEECNRRFNMEMQAINTPGSGVTVIVDEKDFSEKMQTLFINVQKPGLKAIIVNDEQEVRQILLQYALYQDKIHVMTTENYDFHRTRWNLLTIEQAKGLEFGTVLVISGRMTSNKKYIAYTRALDELFIYDLPLLLEERFFEEVREEDKTKVDKKEIAVKEKKEKKKAVLVDYSKSEVKKYFEDKGLEINDMRPNGGYLWVFGEQAQIKQYVDEACEKFAISGSYGTNKAVGFRTGCYFKTKK